MLIKFFIRFLKRIIFIALVFTVGYWVYFKYLSRSEAPSFSSYVESLTERFKRHGLNSDGSTLSLNDQDQSEKEKGASHLGVNQLLNAENFIKDLSEEASDLKDRLTETGLHYSQKLTSTELTKLESLKQILKSKNDNDSRLDSDFKGLSAAMKEALYKNYQNLAAELRNEKGTIAMLVARETSSLADIDFLKKIINEEPCLSLENCKQATNHAVDVDTHKDHQHDHNHEHHHGSKDEIDLSYPQMVVLYQIEQKLSATANNNVKALDPQLKQEFRSVLTEAAEKGTPVMRKKAQDILKKYFR